MSKTYDGALTYTTQAADLSNLGTQLGVTGDSVSAATISYADKNAGTANKTVTLDSATINDGNSGNNYTVTLAGNATSTIAKRDIAIASITAANKTYDGTIAASITSASLSNVVSGETLAMSGSGTFADRNAADGKTVTVADVTALTKTDGTGAWINYNLTSTGVATTTANIAKKVVTLTAGGVSKTYDGTLSYSTQAADLSSLSTQLDVAGDSVSAATISFTDKNAGTANKTVTLDSTTVNDGNSGNNYQLTLAGNATSTIAKRDIAIASITAANKTYDGTNAASITSASLSNVVSGETLAMSGSGTFADRNAVDGKTVTVADVTALTKTDGTGAWSNYNLTSTGSATTTANIAKKVVTLTAGSVNKTYDGTLSYSTQAADLSNLGAQLGVSGDTVSAATIRYADKNAGTANKTVTLDSATVNDGNSGNNYQLTLAGNNASSIGQRSIAVTGITAANKTYDGSSTANIVGANFSNLVAGETLGLSGTGSMVDRNAGTGKTVTVADVLTLAQADGSGAWSNYALGAGSATTTVDVARKAITLTPASASKTYDGLQAYAPQASDMVALSNQLGVSGDTVSAATLAYADKNAGTGKTLLLQSATVADGNGGNNYQLTLASNSTSRIAQADLLVTAVDASKVQDGLPYAGGNGVRYTGWINGETSAELGGTLAYGGTSQGAVLPGIYRIEASGLAATNYSIRYAPGSLSVSNAPAPFLEPLPNNRPGVDTSSTPAAAATSAAASPPATSPATTSLPQRPLEPAPGTSTVSLQIVNEPSPQANGFTLVYVPSTVRTAGQGFRFALPDSALGELARSDILQVKKVDGNALPDWLRFDANARSFVAANVPPGGLPLRVRIVSGGQSTVIELLETNS